MMQVPESPSATARDTTKFKVSELDDRLENGPIEERHCTDVLCCLLFVAFWIGLVFVGITAYAEGSGNVKYLAALYDSDGFPCGLSGTLNNISNNNVSTYFDYTAYPYLYYPIPVPGKTNYRVCLKSCPTVPASGTLPSTLDCMTNSYVQNCTQTTGYDLDYLSVFSSENVSVATNKMFVVYNTTEYLGTFCFPSDLDFWSCPTCTSWITNYLDSSSTIQGWVADMALTWPLLFAVLGIAFLIGFVFMIIMRYFSGIITWLMILSYISSLAVLGGLCYYKYDLLTNNSTGLAAATSNTNSTNASSATDGTNNDTTTSQTLYAFAIFFWVVDGISLIVLCCIYHKINIVIAVLKAGADYMKQVPTALLVPPLLVVVLSLFFAYWIAAFICLFASGAAFTDNSVPWVSVTWSDSTLYLILYHGFGFLWNLAFFMAFSQFVLGSSCAIWYYSQGPDGQEASMTVSRSIWRGIRYHLGSLAFGSLIIAIIETVRLIMAYIHKQLKDTGVTEGNKFIEYAMVCVHCCLNCFERFIQFINRNAYIQIAIRGSHFCQAAKDSFFLIFGNPTLFAVMGGLGYLFLIVGQIFITFVTLCIGYAMVINIYPTKLHSPVMPCVFYFFIAFAVSELFLGVYGMACDTILQCFCVDEELQKSKGREPKHCPEPLREMFDTMEKRPQNKDAKIHPE